MIQRTPKLVLTRDQLDEVVETYLGFEEFVFDVETLATNGKEKGALDTRTNKVFWLSLAGPGGRVDAIPMGHSKGLVDKPKHKEKVTKFIRPGEYKRDGSRYFKTTDRVVAATYRPPPPQLSQRVVFDALEPLFFSDRVKVGHNVKFDLKSIVKYYDNRFPPPPYGDTQTLVHCLNENRYQYALDAIAKDLFGLSYPQIGKNLDDYPISEAARYALKDVAYCWMIWDRLIDFLDREGVRQTYTLEMQLMPVLADMEMEGVIIDRDRLEDLDLDLRESMDEMAGRLYKRAGKKWDLNSHKAKGLFVYDVCNNTPTEFTAKTGQPSTTAKALEKFAARDKDVRVLMEWLDLQKLHSTFVVSLLDKLGDDGKIHPSFWQTKTVTGRLSASKPNVQQIPRVTDDDQARASLIRSMFVAPPGWSCVAADYDQVELRVTAHFSQDPYMVQVFRDGLDPHKMTAALVFRKDIEDVTKDERQIAKNLNFAMVYGAGPAKVAMMSGISERKAMHYLDEFREQYKGVYDWINKLIAQACRRRPPHVVMLGGRKRRLPDLRSGDTSLRLRAERQAVNSVVQGSSAEITKLAMVRFHKAIKGTPTKLVLSVHDELVAITPDEMVEEVGTILTECMEMRDREILSVPLTAPWSAGKTWAAAKG